MKKIIPILFLLLFCVPTFSQNGRWAVIDSALLTHRTMQWPDSNTCFVASLIGIQWPIVRKSTDAGRSWVTAYVDSGKYITRMSGTITDTIRKWPSGSITGFQFPNPKLGIMSMINGYVIRTTDFGETWTEILVDSVPEYEFDDIDMYDDKFGAIISAKHIYITNDGGLNFEKQTLVDSITDWDNCYHRTLFTLNEKSIYVLVQKVMDSSENDRILFVTRDKGKTWQRLNAPIWISKIFFLDEMNGWAGCMETKSVSDNIRRLYVKKTTDGGYSWETSLDTVFNFQGPPMVVFRNKNEGMACAGLFETYYTSDGGKIWVRDTLRDHQSIWSSRYACFSPDGTRYLVSLFYRIFKYEITSNSVEEDFPQFNIAIISPNPANSGSEITIILNNNGGKRATISISDLHGRELLVRNVMINSSSDITMNLPENMSLGVYFVKIETDGMIYFGKLLVY